MSGYFKAKIVNPNSDNFGQTVWASKTVYTDRNDPNYAKMRAYYARLVDGKPTEYKGHLGVDSFEEIVEVPQQRIMNDPTPTLLDFVKNSAGDSAIFYVVNETGDLTTNDPMTYQDAVEQLLHYDGRAYIAAIIAQSEKVIQPYS
jgi:hypothetical protein